MKNQKPLILLLSLALLLATSFIVYSWTEPTTIMPNAYTTPLNTSSNAQVKVGDLGASSFIDADNSNYYINPSGDSVVSGTITIDRPINTNNAATKGYVDEKIAEVAGIVTGAQPLVNGAHSQSDCTTAGGEIVDSDVSYKICRFSSVSCPSGWSPYKTFRTVTEASYTLVTSGNVGCGCSGGTIWPGCYCTVTFASLAWSNNPYRTLSCSCYCHCDACDYNCAATKSEPIENNTQIGCY